jgi:transcriptional regulator with XRE-family HTH domain
MQAKRRKYQTMSGEIFITSGLSEGERIRLARLAKWLRQIDVASLAGVTVAEVANAEKDRYVTSERKDRILKVVELLEDNNAEVAA